MGTTPEINIDDIDPAVYKAVVAHQTRQAITRPMGDSLDKAEALRSDPAGTRAANAQQKAAQADFLNEGGE